MTRAAWFAVPALIGVLATWAGHTRLRGAFVIKALFPATLLALAVASLPASPRPVLSVAVAAGLLFCLPADALLGLPDNRPVFVFGLAGFLLAYLLYGAGLLASGVSLAAAGLAGVVLAAAGVAQYHGFTGLDHALRGPVAVYGGVVSLLVAAAAGFAAGPAGPAGLAPRALVAAGALLIYLSDAMIGHNVFGRPLRNSELVILPPYYAGQICIVLSLYLA
jgi:uncharacterized membrane protein YhhN